MKSCPQCSATFPDEYAVCPKDGTRLTGSGPWEPDSVIMREMRQGGGQGLGERRGQRSNNP